jgi:hypothetical protein
MISPVEEIKQLGGSLDLIFIGNGNKPDFVLKWKHGSVYEERIKMLEIVDDNYNEILKQLVDMPDTKPSPID